MLQNTCYMDYIRQELIELDTKCPDLLTELIIESLIEMNGPIPDASQNEIYDFIEKQLKLNVKGE